ncbi:hypothetical protein [Hyphomicrobium sp. CS1GBMeth3]|uniref:hypothetical protein n=1 Tax=Hyphomicrobium sp. CS1GBMeth3 TaxID=1892845 RepID=UPI000B04AE15|nr:hypothetical protein [Hyphomicrobium sp. CS1GBMeth3]
MATNFAGAVDVISGTELAGWCASKTGKTCNVTVAVNGIARVAFPAVGYRKDLDQLNICKTGGGFRFDVAGFLGFGENDVKLLDPDGVPLPNGSLTIQDRDVILGDAKHLIGDASGRAIGIYGNVSFALDLKRASALSKILYCIGATPVTAPDGSEEFNIWFCDPHNPKPQGLRYLINGGFDDISKSAVDRIHKQIFGRALCVDTQEIRPEDIYVVKSEANATHNGHLVKGVDLGSLDLSGSVVQRVIDNRADSNTVRDIRVVIIGREIPLVYLKTRPLASRFSNANTAAVMTLPHNVFSEDELRQILRFCRTIGLDYGELDVLRDAGDGDIWIVDVNNTPSGPPNGLTKAEANVAVREMSLSFNRQFLSPGLFYASRLDNEG